jgi:hypothetical protein
MKNFWCFLLLCFQETGTKKSSKAGNSLVLGKAMAWYLKGSTKEALQYEGPLPWENILYQRSKDAGKDQGPIPIADMSI